MGLRTRLSAPLLATALALVLGAVAFAAPAPQWKPFGDAQWQPHSGLDSQHGLVTTSNASGTYGGIELRNGPTDPAAITALSFDFVADQTGPSGGSPRLVVIFSDADTNGYAVLRPLTWTADTWAHVDGITGNNWTTRTVPRAERAAPSSSGRPGPRSRPAIRARASPRSLR